ncbi:hypothetical protein [Kitasatospora sp. NPDC098663]|uniref:hypothetical protein n=1 Tax=Kitasatospora sp. NPDC098663 TaxID=3364096 RepID=UPI00380A1A58
MAGRYWVLTAASCFADDPDQPQALAAGAPKWKTTATIGRCRGSLPRPSVGGDSVRIGRSSAGALSGKRVRCGLPFE